MKFHGILFGLVALIVFSGGIAFANHPPGEDHFFINDWLVVTGGSQFNDVMVVNDNLHVNNGDFKYERNDGIQTSMRLLNDQQTTFLFEDTDDNREYFVRYSQDGTLFDMGSVTDGGRNDIAINTVTGNVGIGTSNPAEELHVAGDIRLDRGISFSDFGENNHIFEFDNDLFLQSKDDLVLATSDLIILDEDIIVDGVNNRLGVGTATPSEKLDVDGNARINGDLYVGTEATNDNDRIYFGNSGEFLNWGDFFSTFWLSDDLFIDGTLDVDSQSSTPLDLDRKGNDGTLISLRQDGTQEGTISISGNTVSYNAFTGSHYAWSDKQIPKGTLVSMSGDNKNLHDNPDSEILYGIKVTSTKNDPSVLGTYLSVMDSSMTPSIGNPHLVMSEGNGEIWVANTGADIKPGDYLISSDVPGHAMKDDRSGQISNIIGRAAEPIEWDKVTDTFDGVKHKKISILFNFVPLNNQILN